MGFNVSFLLMVESGTLAPHLSANYVGALLKIRSGTLRLQKNYVPILNEDTYVKYNFFCPYSQKDTIKTLHLQVFAVNLLAST